MGKFRRENPDDFALPIEDCPATVAGIHRRVDLKDPLHASGPHGGHMASGDGGFAQPELKSDGNYLLIQFHRAGVPERGLG